MEKEYLDCLELHLLEKTNLIVNEYVFGLQVCITRDIAHLRQECHNSKFGIFYLLV
jgi:ethanolamine utilization microcompartment shell protein EutS